MVGGFAQGADIFEIAVSAGKVHAIAGNKDVLNIEALIVYVDLAFAATGLVDQGANLNGSGLHGLQALDQAVQGMAAIHDIFDNDDVTALNA